MKRRAKVNNKIELVQKIGFQWPMENPFLFCAYHKDAYPRGNEVQGVEQALLAGREIHNDFSMKKFQ
jgi:quercetin 2,3-dioxygenase